MRWHLEAKVCRIWVWCKSVRSLFACPRSGAVPAAGGCDCAHPPHSHLPRTTVNSKTHSPHPFAATTFVTDTATILVQLGQKGCSLSAAGSDLHDLLPLGALC